MWICRILKVKLEQKVSWFIFNITRYKFVHVLKQFSLHVPSPSLAFDEVMILWIWSVTDIRASDPAFRPASVLPAKLLTFTNFLICQQKSGNYKEHTEKTDTYFRRIQTRFNKDLLRVQNSRLFATDVNTATCLIRVLNGADYFLRN
jgi:hypothetical protein